MCARTENDARLAGRYRCHVSHARDSRVCENDIRFTVSSFSKSVNPGDGARTPSDKSAVREDKSDSLIFCAETASGKSARRQIKSRTWISSYLKESVF